MAHLYDPAEQTPRAGALSRFAASLCLLAALLVVHWGAPTLDRASYREISSILNGIGTMGTDDNVSLPSIQPPGLSRTIVTEARHHSSVRKLAIAHDGPWALAPSAVPVPAVLSAGEPHPTAAGDPALLAPRFFEQRAPPSTT